MDIDVLLTLSTFSPIGEGISSREKCKPIVYMHSKILTQYISEQNSYQNRNSLRFKRGKL